MFWSLPLDDFNGSQCGEGKYPLITAVKDHLLSVSSSQLPKRTIPKKAPQESRKTFRKKPKGRNHILPYNRCHAIGKWAGNAAIGLDVWCANNCAVGNCPSSLCLCDRFL